jgi:hypothetical protein
LVIDRSDVVIIDVLVIIDDFCSGEVIGCSVEVIDCSVEVISSTNIHIHIIQYKKISIA